MGVVKNNKLYNDKIEIKIDKVCKAVVNVISVEATIDDKIVDSYLEDANCKNEAIEVVVNNIPEVNFISDHLAAKYEEKVVEEKVVPVNEDTVALKQEDQTSQVPTIVVEAVKEKRSYKHKK